MKKLLITIGALVFLLGHQAVKGQDIVLSPQLKDSLTQVVVLSEDPSFAQFRLQRPALPAARRAQTAHSPHFLPAYARKNPSGYSYLCRLELDIENRLPIGIWVDLGDQIGASPSAASASLRLKLKRF